MHQLSKALLMLVLLLAPIPAIAQELPSPVQIEQTPDNLDETTEEPEEEFIEEEVVEEPVEEQPAEEFFDDGSELDTSAVDAVTPPVNPLNSAGDELERLIQARINDDMWKSMLGRLPCADTSVACVQQLQQLAIANNRTLGEIDLSVEEIKAKIEEARAANKKAVELSIFRPLVQSYLQLQTVTNPTTGQPQRRGLLNRIVSIFTNPVDGINEILSLIGIPLLDGITGTNAEAQRNAIAISDLQVKSAELMRGRAELAEKIRESVALQVIEFDTAAREFQISQVIAQREVIRMELLEVEYRFGESDTRTYLGNISSLDAQKATTLRSWTQMRSRLERIKLLVLGEGDE